MPSRVVNFSEFVEDNRGTALRRFLLSCSLWKPWASVCCGESTTARNQCKQRQAFIGRTWNAWRVFSCLFKWPKTLWERLFFKLKMWPELEPLCCTTAQFEMCFEFINAIEYCATFAASVTGDILHLLAYYFADDKATYGVYSAEAYGSSCYREAFQCNEGKGSVNLVLRRWVLWICVFVWIRFVGHFLLLEPTFHQLLCKLGYVDTKVECWVSAAVALDPI